MRLFSLIQEKRHIEIAGRMLQCGQHKGYLAAVLCAMIDHMDHCLPERQRGRDTFKVLIRQVAGQSVFCQSSQERACLLFLLLPA